MNQAELIVNKTLEFLKKEFPELNDIKLRYFSNRKGEVKLIFEKVQNIQTFATAFMLITEDEALEYPVATDLGNNELRILGFDCTEQINTKNKEDEIIYTIKGWDNELDTPNIQEDIRAYPKDIIKELSKQYNIKDKDFPDLIKNHIYNTIQIPDNATYKDYFLNIVINVTQHIHQKLIKQYCL